MRGSMRQRSAGSWELRAFVGRDPLTGRRQYVTKTFRGGRREAERELAALVSSAETARPTASMTVGEALEQWYEHAKPQLSPSTVATTRVVLDAHLLPYLETTPLRKLTPSKIDAVYRALREKGGRKGKPLAWSTVQRAHNVLHRAMAQAVRWGWLPLNPVSNATAPKRDHHELRPPSPAEVLRVVEHAEHIDQGLGVYLLLAASTGARRSELVALRWTDLDLDAGVAMIGRGVVTGPDGLVEKDTKTHAARRIAIDERTVEVLKAHHEQMSDNADACAAELPVNAFVFSDEADGSRPWKPDFVTQAFARAAKRAGVPNARLHDLRHFVATRLLANGVDVRTVAGRLGHKNPNVTLNVYAAFLPEADRDAADVIGKLLVR